MRRPKVVRVYKGIKAGGGVHSRLLELLPRLREHADLRVLCYRWRGDRADELERAGIPVDVIPLGSKWAPWNLARYVAYFRAQAPDVVHTHEFTANTFAIAAAARAGVPVRVRHLHTLVPWGWGGRIRTALRVAADRRAARGSQMTLAVSEAVRRLYLSRTRLPEASCRVLYNGVDLDRFRNCRESGAAVRAEWGVPPGAPLVGTVGRLSQGKGLRELLLASRRLAAELPEARVVLVGDGGLRPELEAFARELGLADRVIFAGPRRDVPAVLGALDLFLFAGVPDALGRVQDGLPGAVLEAQAAGLAVVASRLPMMEELVEDGASGALVPPGDPESLAAAALRYLRDPDLRRAAGTVGEGSVRRFSLEECVRHTVELYHELLRGAGAG